MRSFLLYTGCAGGPEATGGVDVWGGGEDIPPRPPSKSMDAACDGAYDCVGAGELDGPLLKRSMILATFD